MNIKKQFTKIEIKENKEDNIILTLLVIFILLFLGIVILIL